jgi:hypothetical protein
MLPKATIGRNHSQICHSKRHSDVFTTKYANRSDNPTQPQPNMLLKATTGRNHNQICYSKRQSDTDAEARVVQGFNITSDVSTTD